MEEKAAAAGRLAAALFSNRTEHVTYGQHKKEHHILMSLESNGKEQLRKIRYIYLFFFFFKEGKVKHISRK